MISKSGNLAVKAFIEGKTKSTPNTISTGRELFLFGNKIAEWREDGLYISNGGYTVETRNGNEVIASNTTKTRLNDLPNVRIGQSKNKIYLNGKEWDGSFIHIPEAKKPSAIESTGDVFNMETKYHNIDGWRGFVEYNYAVIGGNDTGTWSDSPCNTNVVMAELDAVKKKLHEAGIKTKDVTVETSNVFCISHQVIVKMKDIEEARKIVAEHLEAVKAKIIYAIK
jgi:hypothetical protein